MDNAQLVASIPAGVLHEFRAILCNEASPADHGGSNSHLRLRPPIQASFDWSMRGSSGRPRRNRPLDSWTPSALISSMGRRRISSQTTDSNLAATVLVSCACLMNQLTLPKGQCWIPRGPGHHVLAALIVPGILALASGKRDTPAPAHAPLSALDLTLTVCLLAVPLATLQCPPSRLSPRSQLFLFFWHIWTAPHCEMEELEPNRAEPPGPEVLCADVAKMAAGTAAVMKPNWRAASSLCRHSAAGPFNYAGAKRSSVSSVRIAPAAERACETALRALLADVMWAGSSPSGSLTGTGDARICTVAERIGLLALVYGTTRHDVEPAYEVLLDEILDLD
ncbi:hypothetical protein GGX14DRAFT_567149 [Mycena pura]|uniref:Uncharacterized protein n=1 Tax=Mycena pura TaxID=153505 RepID=A0AAD6YDT5_9AGAR|nr:hypothetical protein GGX14DRAFT_567149 [Mycena pura]